MPNNFNLPNAQLDALNTFISSQGDLIGTINAADFNRGTKILYLERAVSLESEAFMRTLDKIVLYGELEQNKNRTEFIKVLKTINDFCFNNIIVTHVGQHVPALQHYFGKLGSINPAVFRAHIQKVIKEIIVKIQHRYSVEIEQEKAYRIDEELLIRSSSEWHKVVKLPSEYFNRAPAHDAPKALQHMNFKSLTVEQFKFLQAYHDKILRILHHTDLRINEIIALGADRVDVEATNTNESENVIHIANKLDVAPYRVRQDLSPGKFALVLSHAPAVVRLVDTKQFSFNDVQTLTEATFTLLLNNHNVIISLLHTKHIMLRDVLSLMHADISKFEMIMGLNPGMIMLVDLPDVSFKNILAVEALKLDLLLSFPQEVFDLINTCKISFAYLVKLPIDKLELALHRTAEILSTIKQCKVAFTDIILELNDDNLTFIQDNLDAIAAIVRATDISFLDIFRTAKDRLEILVKYPPAIIGIQNSKKVTYQKLVELEIDKLTILLHHDLIFLTLTAEDKVTFNELVSLEADKLKFVLMRGLSFLNLHTEAQVKFAEIFASTLNKLKIVADYPCTIPKLLNTNKITYQDLLALEDEHLTLLLDKFPDLILQLICFLSFKDIIALKVETLEIADKYFVPIRIVLLERIPGFTVPKLMALNADVIEFVLKNLTQIGQLSSDKQLTFAEIIDPVLKIEKATDLAFKDMIATNVDIFALIIAHPNETIALIKSKVITFEEIFRSEAKVIAVLLSLEVGFIYLKHVVDISCRDLKNIDPEKIKLILHHYKAVAFYIGIAKISFADIVALDLEKIRFIFNNYTSITKASEVLNVSLQAIISLEQAKLEIVLAHQENIIQIINATGLTLNDILKLGASKERLEHELKMYNIFVKIMGKLSITFNALLALDQQKMTLLLEHQSLKLDDRLLNFVLQHAAVITNLQNKHYITLADFLDFVTKIEQGTGTPLEYIAVLDTDTYALAISRSKAVADFIDISGLTFTRIISLEASKLDYALQHSVAITHVAKKCANCFEQVLDLIISIANATSIPLQKLIALDKEILELGLTNVNAFIELLQAPGMSLQNLIFYDKGNLALALKYNKSVIKLMIALNMPFQELFTNDINKLEIIQTHRNTELAFVNLYNTFGIKPKDLLALDADKFAVIIEHYDALFVLALENIHLRDLLGLDSTKLKIVLSRPDKVISLAEKTKFSFKMLMHLDVIMLKHLLCYDIKIGKLINKHHIPLAKIVSLINLLLDGTNLTCSDLPIYDNSTFIHAVNNPYSVLALLIGTNVQFRDLMQLPVDRFKKILNQQPKLFELARTAHILFKDNSGIEKERYTYVLQSFTGVNLFSEVLAVDQARFNFIMDNTFALTDVARKGNVTLKDACKIVVQAKGTKRRLLI